MSSTNQSKEAKRHSGHIFIAPTFVGRTLNEEHPIFSKLNEQQRRSVIESVEGLGAIRFSDDWGSAATKSLRENWNSPIEMLANEFAWNAIKHFEPSTFDCSIKDVLSANALDPKSLDCLNLDDRNDLERSLMAAAVKAYRSETDVTSSVREAMTTWLKKHTETDGTTEELIEIARCHAREDGKKRYAVDVTAELSLEIQVDARTPQEAKAMAEAWTFYGAGSDCFNDCYDYELDKHHDEPFTLEWEVTDLNRCDADNVELISNELLATGDAEIGPRLLLIPKSE